MRKQLRERLDEMFKEIDEEGKRSVVDKIILNHEIDNVTILYQKHGLLVLGSDSGSINSYYYEDVRKTASSSSGLTYWTLNGDSEHATFHAFAFAVIDKTENKRIIRVAWFPKLKKWIRIGKQKET